MFVLPPVRHLLKSLLLPLTLVSSLANAKPQTLSLFDVVHSNGENIVLEENSGFEAFKLKVYGCSRPIGSHAECDTEVGIMKGEDADLLFLAIDQVEAEHTAPGSHGRVTVVGSATITCRIALRADASPQCLTELLTFDQ